MSDRPVISMTVPTWWAANIAAQRRAADILVDRYQRGILTPGELHAALTMLLAA